MTEIIETTPTIEETVPPKSEEVKKICPNVKTYCRKSNGEIITYIYDQSPYSKKYYEKIKDTLKEYVDCEICNCRYQKWNKGHHYASKKHIKAHEALRDKELQEMILKNGGKSNLQLFLEQCTFG
jgi:hypothetical protein